MTFARNLSLLALGVLVASFIVFQQNTPVSALALKMQPLMYKDTLKKGEKKKGFVDISNPTASTVRLKTSVQAFRQIDDQGSLQFYDEAQIQAGITPDLAEFDLGPREAVRMDFLIDGTKLPPGDVYAALFVSTDPGNPKAGATSSLRVGTLLSLVNGTPGARDAEITDASVPFWQFGDTIHGSYSIKNTAKSGTTTGFFPTVSVAINPFQQTQEFQSSLVFAGHTRQNEFQMKTNRIGLYKIRFSYGNNSRATWIFVGTETVITAGAILAALAGLGWTIRHKMLKRKPSHHSKKRSK